MDYWNGWYDIDSKSINLRPTMDANLSLAEKCRPIVQAIDILTHHRLHLFQEECVHVVEKQSLFSI